MSEPGGCAIASCSSCPCGKAAGVRYGGRCPLVDRKRGRDELLALEGEAAHTVWFIKRGTVVLSRSAADGVDRPRAVRGPGSFVGLEALIRTSYSDSARTSEPSVVCGIAREGLDAWFGPKGTPVRMALEQTLIADADDRPRAAAADGTATQRVARWLLAEASDTSHVPRQVTAALLGIVPETLSRALARLHDDGAIVVTRQSVTVRDRARLDELAR